MGVPSFAESGHTEEKFWRHQAGITNSHSLMSAKPRQTLRHRSKMGINFCAQLIKIDHSDACRWEIDKVHTIGLIKYLPSRRSLSR